MSSAARFPWDFIFKEAIDSPSIFYYQYTIFSSSEKGSSENCVNGITGDPAASASDLVRDAKNSAVRVTMDVENARAWPGIPFANHRLTGLLDCIFCFQN